MDTESIRIGPSWNTGDQRNLEVEIRRNAKPSAASVTPVTLTVLEVSEQSGVRFEWQSSQSVINGLPPTPGVIQLLERLPRERIVYRLDDEAAFVGVENVEEIRSAYAEIADLLGEAQMSQSEAAARSLSDSLSDESVAQIFSERPMIYHALDGIVLDTGSPVTFADILPNPLGGEPYPATTTIEITDLGDADGCMEVTMTVLPDPDDFVRILAASMEAAGILEDPSTFEVSAESAKIENTIVAKYDPTTGFAKSVYASQLIEFEGQRRFDETTIRDITPA
jgi:hypothetical protein